MATVFILLVLLVGAGLTTTLAGGWIAPVKERQRKQRLLGQLRTVDARIARDSRAAKRAMNDAAGQSWRNRFE